MKWRRPKYTTEKRVEQNEEQTENAPHGRQTSGDRKQISCEYMYCQNWDMKKFASGFRSVICLRYVACVVRWKCVLKYARNCREKTNSCDSYSAWRIIRWIIMNRNILLATYLACACVCEWAWATCHCFRCRWTVSARRKCIQAIGSLDSHSFPALAEQSDATKLVSRASTYYLTSNSFFLSF